MKRGRFTALAAAGFAAPALAAAQTATKVRIGSIPVESYALAFYAKDAGFFARNGVDADVQIIPGASGGITAALVGGSIDVGCVSIGPMANAHVRGIPIRIIAAGGICSSTSPTTSMIVKKDSPLRSGRDLNGKTIGTTVLRDLMHVATLKWIDDAGGDSSTVKVVEIPLPDAALALSSGRIDAYPQAEPFLTNELDSGDFRNIGDIYTAIAPRVMISMHISTTGWLAANAALARRVVLSLRQAAQWATSDRSAANAVLAQETKIPAASIARMHHVIQGQSLDPGTIQPQIDALAHYKFIDHDFPLSDIVWRG